MADHDADTTEQGVEQLRNAAAALDQFEQQLRSEAAAATPSLAASPSSPSSSVPAAALVSLRELCDAGLLPESLYSANVAAIRESTARLDAAHERLARKAATTRQAVVELDASCEAMQGRVAEIADDERIAQMVRQRMDDLRHVIDAKEKALLADLAEMGAERRRMATDRLGEARRLTAQFGSLLQEVQLLDGNRASRQFAKQAADLEGRLDAQLRRRGQVADAMVATERSIAQPMAVGVGAEGLIDVDAARRALFAINFDRRAVSPPRRWRFTGAESGDGSRLSPKRRAALRKVVGGGISPPQVRYAQPDPSLQQKPWRPGGILPAREPPHDRPARVPRSSAPASLDYLSRSHGEQMGLRSAPAVRSPRLLRALDTPNMGIDEEMEQSLAGDFDFGSFGNAASVATAAVDFGSRPDDAHAIHRELLVSRESARARSATSQSSADGGTSRPSSSGAVSLTGSWSIPPSPARRRAGSARSAVPTKTRELYSP